MSNPPQMEKRPRPRRKPDDQSAYEELESRSAALDEERRKGGLGTAQPPAAAKPLLHPSFGEPTPTDQTSARTQKKSQPKPPDQTPARTQKKKARSRS